MRRILSALLLAGSLIGCAAPQDELMWAKPGGSDMDRQQALYECERDTRMSAPSFGGGFAGANAAQDFAQRCMGAKGYSLVRTSDYYYRPSHAPDEPIGPMMDASGRTYKPDERVICQYPSATTDFPAKTCVSTRGKILGPA